MVKTKQLFFFFSVIFFLDFRAQGKSSSLFNTLCQMIHTFKNVPENVQMIEILFFFLCS